MRSEALAVPQREYATPVERWYVLIVVSLVYAINIAARYVVTTVFEPIRLELALSDAGAAFLTGIPLALFYVTCGIPIASLADRWNRRNILAASLVLWSGFTALCGLAVSYTQFLFARIGVGVGEAGATPASNAIVSDYFPPARRPMALSVLALGAPIGAWLGSDFAGAVAHLYGWRGAFIALGLPGIVVGALVFLTVREPARGRMDAAVVGATASWRESLAAVWHQRAAFHVIMGSGVCSLWGWGLAYWTTTFLMRTYNLDVGQAGAITGRVNLIGGIAGMLVTVWLLSRPVMADSRRVLRLLAVVIALATIPSFIAYWTGSLMLAKIMLWLYIPAIYFFIGPCMGLVQNAAPTNMRALFTAWSVLVGNVFNLIVAPQAVGFMSDWFAHGRGADAASLRLALLVLAPTGFWAVLHFIVARRTIVDDQRRATGYVTG